MDFPAVSFIYKIYMKCMSSMTNTNTMKKCLLRRANNFVSRRLGDESQEKGISQDLPAKKNSFKQKVKIVASCCIYVSLNCIVDTVACR